MVLMVANTKALMAIETVSVETERFLVTFLFLCIVLTFVDKLMRDVEI